MSLEISNKSMSAPGHEPPAEKLLDGLKDTTFVMNAVLARLKEYGAGQIEVPPELFVKWMRAADEVMDGDDGRAKMAAGKILLEMAKFNLQRVDAADKIARGGNAPSQTVQKVYVNVPESQP